MLILSNLIIATAALQLPFAGQAHAGSLADINHVVLFMQENRAFDHYFGTMAGVRGFSDPNVQMNPGNRSVWQQDVNSTLTNATDSLLPWHLNYLGGDWTEATQCMVAGDNGWTDNHAALNGDLNNKWALNNTPWSWGYYKRDDLPVHFAIAEGWTVGDMYQESVIASTNPNRVTWVSGSINAPGSPQTPDQGGMTIDNNEIPGCEAPNLNCYPLKWKTAPELYQEAGVSWQVYQDADNFDDNPLAWFDQYQRASNSSALGSRGMSYIGLDRFYADAAAGTLPQISYIIGPSELSEHPPYQPKDGAWLQRQVVDAVINSPAYNNTALIISYDETGGWGDHVVPFHSPPSTSGEWITDPYPSSGSASQLYTGPGFRVPFYIISPWTRGGNVFVDHADHTSQLLFLDAWLSAKGHNLSHPAASQIPAWRRTHMSDLVNAFDFAHPDYSQPSLPAAAPPTTDTAGTYNGYALCEATHSSTRPPVPYDNQTTSTSLASEKGYKTVRGQMTEGRFLVFEMNGRALSNPGSGTLKTSAATADHADPAQRWVLHLVDAGTSTARSFNVTSARDGRYLGNDGRLVTDVAEAHTHEISDLGDGRGYSLCDVVAGGQCLAIGLGGEVEWFERAEGFGVWSVT
ncbi:phospholipase C [Saccharata proteae CBS 121410]|uniref:Phospholipase C n=1 Tax=Saccharata proteae CBS 121410 TaxID=1314787 RepID=A0A9P4LV30_9PEZI|nr:phospholipase C [Saccharata proteae CBS 121410]